MPIAQTEMNDRKRDLALYSLLAATLTLGCFPICTVLVAILTARMKEVRTVHEGRST